MFHKVGEAISYVSNLFAACILFRIFGAFDFSVRQYIVRDPEVCRRIAIKDFDHFQDHRIFIDENIDELTGNSLVSLRGEKWRQMRATLSPAFTGSKMRQMFELVSECAEGVVEHFRDEAESGAKIDIDMKDFFSRYANDVIATSAFGIEVNSFADEDNEFFLNGKKSLEAGGLKRTIRVIILMIMPKIAKALKLKRLDASVIDSFKNIFLGTMEFRKKNNIHRPDMINIMMQVREEKSKEIADGFTTVEESELGKAIVTRKFVR